MTKSKQNSKKYHKSGMIDFITQIPAIYAKPIIENLIGTERGFEFRKEKDGSVSVWAEPDIK